MSHCCCCQYILCCQRQITIHFSLCNMNQSCSSYVEFPSQTSIDDRRGLSSKVFNSLLRNFTFLNLFILITNCMICICCFYTIYYYDCQIVLCGVCRITLSWRTKIYYLSYFAFEIVVGGISISVGGVYICFVKIAKVGCN